MNPVNCALALMIVLKWHSILYRSFLIIKNPKLQVSKYFFSTNYVTVSCLNQLHLDWTQRLFQFWCAIHSYPTLRALLDHINAKCWRRKLVYLIVQHDYKRMCNSSSTIDCCCAQAAVKVQSIPDDCEQSFFSSCFFLSLLLSQAFLFFFRFFLAFSPAIVSCLNSWYQWV